MGLRDVVFGRKKLSEPRDDRLFALGRRLFALHGRALDGDLLRTVALRLHLPRLRAPALLANPGPGHLRQGQLRRLLRSPGLQARVSSTDIVLDTLLPTLVYFSGKELRPAARAISLHPQRNPLICNTLQISVGNFRSKSVHSSQSSRKIFSPRQIGPFGEYAQPQKTLTRQE